MYSAGNLCSHRASVTSVVTPKQNQIDIQILKSKGGIETITKDFKLISGSRDHSIIIWGDLSAQEEADLENSKNANTTNNNISDGKKLSKRARRKIAQTKAEISSSNTNDESTISTTSSTTSTSAASSTAGAPLAHPLRKLEGHSGFISDLCLSDDRRFLLSASWDKTLRLWSLVKEDNGGKNNSNNNNNSKSSFGSCIAKCVGHTKDVLSCCFATSLIDAHHVSSSSSSALFALSGSRDCTIRLWNLGFLVVGSKKKNHQPDENNNNDEDNNSELFNNCTKTCDLIPSALDGNNAICLRVFGGDNLYSASNSVLAASGGDEMLINKMKMDWVSCVRWINNEVNVTSATVPRVTAAMKKHFAFVSGSWDGCLRKWVVDVDEVLASSSGPVSKSIIISSSSEDVGGVDDHDKKSKSSAKSSHLVDTRIDIHGKSAVTAVAISPDTSIITSAGKDGSLQVLENPPCLPHNKFSDEPMFVIPLAKEQINCVVYSPVRFWICCACDSGIKVWDLEARRTIIECASPHELQYVKTPPVPTSCDFSHDGETLYVGYSDNIVRVFCMNSRRL